LRAWPRALTALARVTRDVRMISTVPDPKSHPCGQVIVRWLRVR
jgi:hypothetical protein